MNFDKNRALIFPRKSFEDQNKSPMLSNKVPRKLNFSRLALKLKQYPELLYYKSQLTKKK